MKRSRRVGLLAASASLIILAGCYEEEAPAVRQEPVEISQAAVPHEDKVFKNLEACLADVPSGSAETDEKRLKCISDWETAKADHEKNAPRFATLAECQAEFGPEACGAAPAAAGATASSGGSDGSFFMPLLMGYMIGNALSGPSPAYYDRSGGYRGYSNSGSASQRLKSSTAFVNPNGSTTGSRFTTSPSRSSVQSTAPRTMQKATPSRSSGFGRSGSSRGFGG